MTSLPPLAEALYLAHKRRSTGSLKVSAGGRQSELLLQDGDLVGAEVRWGYQTSAQAVLRAHLIDSSALDALWARGERGAPDARTLEECGLDARRALEVQALAHVEKLTGKADSIQFDEGEVRPKFEPISGFRVVRAAWRPEILESNGSSVFRCPDPSRCQPWLLSDEERDFLHGFESFKAAAGASRAQLALLELLRREGTVESVEAAAIRPEPEEISWADLLDDEPAAAPVRPLEAAAASEPVPVPPAAEAEAMRAARSRAEDELALEMSEALRRSSTSKTQDWLIAPSAGQVMIELSPLDAISVEDSGSAVSEAAAAPPDPPASIRIAHAIEPQPSLWRSSPPVLNEVQFVGPGPVVANTEGKKTPDRAVEQKASASFEEALRQVVSHVPVLEEKGPAHQESASADVSPEESAWFVEEEDLASDPSDPTRARRQRLLRRSMENLGAPGTRPSEPISAVVVSPQPAGDSPPAPAAAPHTSDEKALAEAIENRYRDVQARKDYFTLLGLPQSATVEEVKTAFLELAKVFHPDRLPASLGHLSAKVTAIFEAVREAYDTLQSDSKRAPYMATLAPDKKTDAPNGADPKQAAEEAYKRGENLMRKRDYVSAEQAFQTAFELDAKAVHLAAAAWALYMDPNRREEAARAKQMMADALKRDPNCERAHYQLGVIARVEGEIERSEKHFREAVRIDPRHMEANQELRLIQMRKKKDFKRRLFGGKPE